MSTSARDALVATAQPSIQFAARKLARQLGLPATAADDIAQDLTVLLLKRAQLHDPSRGAPATFVAQVLRSGIRTWLRDRRRLKRGSGRAVSIERVPQARELFVAEAEAEALSDLAGDLAAVRDRLPAEIQPVFDGLKATQPATLAQRLGWSRRKVANAMSVIRDRLVRAGFGEILGQMRA